MSYCQSSFPLYFILYYILNLLQVLTILINLSNGLDYNYPQICSDGSGGAMLAWSIDTIIYTQKINSSGHIQWTEDGIVVISSPTYKYNVRQFYSDGFGGAIIAWSVGSGFYVQRINSTGHIQWEENGVMIINNYYEEEDPQICNDGLGGVLITWSSYIGIYAQRINSTGHIQWDEDGVSVSTALGGQYNPKINSDSLGGAIITWMDYRNDWNTVIYAQRINSTGHIQWEEDDIKASNSSYDQSFPQIYCDGFGGAFIAWNINNGIYAQLINSTGYIQWDVDGIEVSNFDNDQKDQQIYSDGLNGVIIAWSANNDIYAQRINSTGHIQWDEDGVAICIPSYSSQVYPQICSTGTEGAIITWIDYRNGEPNIYTQKINGSGYVQWEENGVKVENSYFVQEYPQICSDDLGGVIIAWSKGRYNYVQRINSSGHIQWGEEGKTILIDPRIHNIPLGNIYLLITIIGIFSLVISTHQKLSSK